MLSIPSSLRALLLAALAGRGLGSRISFFFDSECESFSYDVRGPNGYPDGDCTLLNTKGNFSSFKVARLDRGCDVTIYGPDTSQGICSPDGSVVADIGRCYNDSSWKYYSIDTCIRQQDDSSESASSTPATSLSFSTSSSVPSTSLQQASASASTSSSGSASSSDTDTGAIAGGVVGGVAGLALIGGGMWFFLRRRRRSGKRGTDTGPSEMSGEAVVEMYGKEVPKPSELPEARAEAYVEPPPQELSAEGERGIGAGREDKPQV